MKIRYLLFCLIVLLLPGISYVSAKKIKQSFRIDKVKEKIDAQTGKDIKIIEIILTDTLSHDPDEISRIHLLKQCIFSGYDKEANSSKESFLLTNNAQDTIVGFKVRIDYLDMQGRMIHSREVEERCEIPMGETRRIDTKSWDIQHTYYYYLGNEPKKVATPFKVSFTPQLYRLKK